MLCSADSSIKIWKCLSRQSELKNVLEIKPANLWAPVNDVSWSPINSTTFVMASADGRIQVWNVSKSLLDPVVNISPRSPSAKDREYTKILFAHCSQIIVVGNDDGKVEVLELKRAETSPVEDLHRCLDNIWYKIQASKDLRKLENALRSWLTITPFSTGTRSGSSGWKISGRRLHVCRLYQQLF